MEAEDKNISPENNGIENPSVENKGKKKNKIKETEVVSKNSDVLGFIFIVCTILLGVLIFAYCSGEFDGVFKDKYENVDNLVGLCGMKIGDSKKNLDAYLFKKMNTKAKFYKQNDVYLSDKYDYFIKNGYNINISQKEVDYLKSHYINNGKFIDIRPNGWDTTKGLNLIVYEVHGFNIKDLMLEDLRLVFYNNKLMHILVNQTDLGKKLFRAKYGEHDSIKNGNIVARNSDYNELKIYDKALLEDYEKELDVKRKANQIIENQNLLKEYSDY